MSSEKCSVGEDVHQGVVRKKKSTWLCTELGKCRDRNSGSQRSELVLWMPLLNSLDQCQDLA